MLNKTPADKDVKTELAPKTNAKNKSNSLSKLNLVLVVILAITLLVLSTIIFSNLTDHTIAINNHKFNVNIASNPRSREKGLSGTNRLGKNQGMLFKYTDSGIYCMWMKDMKYDIDIIWLDENKKVIDLKSNVAASSYPEVFCPKTDSKYVLELAKGSISEYKISIGSQAVL